MDTSYRKKITDRKAIRDYSISQLKKHNDISISLKNELSDHKKIREVYQQAALHTQTFLEKHLSVIVTNAIRSVFYEKNMEFKVEFDKKRNSTECALTILEDGEEYDIIEDKGFGVADIASFALRVAYILLDSVDNVLILDEPFRNLDKKRIPFASKMVQELSHKLGIQFIIVTHIEALAECADNSMYVSISKKLSSISTIFTNIIKTPLKSPIKKLKLKRLK
jgi:DNA repair exonuclease SbcCD ATPase subunit